MHKLLSSLILFTALLSAPALIAQEDIDVNFAVLTMQVSGPPGSGATTPSGVKLIQTVNEAISIEAHSSSGYKFAAWTQKGRGQIADSTSSSTSITLTGNSIVTAHFVLENEADLSGTLTLAVSPEASGTVSPSTSLTLPYGSIQTISASANSGYQFINWALEGPGIIDNIYSHSTTVTISGNVSLTAVFAKTEDVVSLTISAGQGGSVLNAGTYYLIKGSSRNLNALALPNYIFTGWQATGLFVMDAENSPQNKITVYENSTVNATFANYTCPFSHKSRKILIKKSDLSGGNGSYVKNKDRVVVKNLPMCLSPNTFDPNTDLINVIIDGNSFPVNKDNGIFKTFRHGYRYTSFSKTPRLKLILDFTKGTWTFTASKAELTSLNSFDGVDIILNVNDSYFGKNYNMEERTSWSFNAKKNTSKLLTTPGTAISDFTIAKATFKIRNNKDAADHLKITNAQLALPEGPAANINELIVSLTIADQTIIIPKGSFEQTPSGQFLYKNKNAKLLLKIDLSKQKWSATYSKFSGWSNLNPEKAINVFLTIGSYESGIELYPNVKRTLIYNYNKIYWSNRQKN